MDILHISQVDNQRQLITLHNDQGVRIEIKYEPVKHAIRVKYAGVKRLFFYEPDPFFPSKGVLLNEYGLLIGKLNCKLRNKGVIQFHENKLSFELLQEQGKLILHGPALTEPLVCTGAFLQQATDQVDVSLLRSVLLVLAWSTIANA